MNSLIRASVNNPVAVNIFMAAIIFFGLYKGLTITREFFPETDFDRVIIRTIYPGATPEESEKGVVVKIENAIEGVQGIEEVSSQAQENAGVVIVKVDSDYSLEEVAQDIRDKIDLIDDLPAETEEPIVEVLEAKTPAISLVVYGTASERRLKSAAEEMKNELLASPLISDVAVTGIRDEEISVEVQPDLLEAYGLTFGQVGTVLRQSNVDLAGGDIEAPMGKILVRTLGEEDTGLALEDVILRSDLQGRSVRLGDVADVRDEFEDTPLRGRFQGQRAIQVTVFKQGDEDAIDISNYVKAYIERKAPEFAGDAIKLEYRLDLARFIQQRIDLMAKNAMQGLVLVFLALAFFLNLRLAFWVGVGLAVSFLGTFVLMDLLGATVNMISLFGLIIVIGLIVDDAIVVSENIFGRMEEGEPPHKAAVEGTIEVAGPVVATVLTTIVAFLPLAFITGVVGDFLAVLPIVVIAALSLSLMEAFIMMPSHLAEHGGKVARKGAGGLEQEKPESPLGRMVYTYNHWKYQILDVWCHNGYEWVLRLAVRWRYVTIGLGIFVAMGTVALLQAGMLPFVLFQRIDSDTVVVELEMTSGSAAQRTEQALSQIAAPALEYPEVQNLYQVVGFQEEAEVQNLAEPERIGEVIAELVDSQDREVTSQELINRWRDDVGAVAGATRLKFRERQGGPGGPEIEIRVRGPNTEVVDQAVRHVKDTMTGYVGVRDIEDDAGTGKLEMRVRVRDSARALGLTEEDVARQVRNAFFGFEAQTLQRGQEEVEVWVRMSEQARSSMLELQNLRLEAPSGERVPLGEVADIEAARGVPAIKRINGLRTITITADVDYALANTDEITASLEEDFADIGRDFPGVILTFEGAKKETSESIGSLRYGFPVALILIYCVLAVLFKSYTQPLIVMTAIPFAIIGAMLGHLLYGLIPGMSAMPITFLSLIGMVGLCGIVVNDSLILISFINEYRRRHPGALREAIIMAGRRRLRPIVLTSITTVFGLAPILLETSFQAQFLIPMAISISFGLALATVLTLVLLPCLYMVSEDLRTLLNWLLTGRWEIVYLAKKEYLSEEEQAGPA